MFGTLLGPGPRTEDRGPYPYVCRAGSHGVLEVAAHPGREPGGVGVVREQLLADAGEPLEGGLGVRTERRDAEVRSGFLVIASSSPRSIDAAARFVSRWLR